MPARADATALRTLRVYAWSGERADLVGQVETIGPAWPPAARGGRFRYARAWLDAAHGFALDPIHLPLLRGWQAAPEGAQLHGVLRDAAPDGWGRRLLERRYPDASFGLLEYLATTEDGRVGCLACGPDDGSAPLVMDPLGRPAPAEPDLPLDRLLALSDRVDGGDALPAEAANAFFASASSLGGARPKATVVDNDGVLWLAKFPARDDPFDVARAEAACLDMADAAGIAASEHVLVTVDNRAILLLRRFDRVRVDGIPRRLAYLSAESALGAAPDAYRSDRSYADLAAAARRLGAPAAPTAAEIFRRMLLNVLVGNTDDHLRNHAFLRDPDGAWGLSPLFDVVPQTGRNPMVLRLGTGHAADLADAVAAHRALGLPTDAASAIAAQVLAVARRWREFMAAREVRAADLSRLEPSFRAVERSRGAPAD